MFAGHKRTFATIQTQRVISRPQLYTTSLEDSTIGIFLNITTDSLYLTQVSECNVATPVYRYNPYSSVSGTVTTNCGVVSVAMVNDPNRDLYDYDTNKNSQTECSFVVCDSTNIVAAFMNTHLSEWGLAADGQNFPGVPSPRMTSWAVSTNAGTNFTDKGPLLPISTITEGSTVITNGASNPMHGDVGDTTMTYDSASNVIYLFVNTSRESTNYYGGRLWTSTDKGRTFNPVNLDVPGLDGGGNHMVHSEDKPMIRVNSSNHKVYAAGSGSDGTNYVWGAVSSDGGTNWSLFNILERVYGGKPHAVDIAIVPDGTVYFFWLHMDDGPSQRVTNYFRYAWLSTNSTWSSVATIGPILNSTNSEGRGTLLRTKRGEFARLF